MPATNTADLLAASIATLSTLVAGQRVSINLSGSAPYIGTVHDVDANGAVIAHNAVSGRILTFGRNQACEKTGNLVLLGTSRKVGTYVVTSIEILG